jgi:hypothetical protein
MPNDPAAVRDWATQGSAGHDSYPVAMPRRTCEDLFATLSCNLEASFLAPMGVASTEVLVFQEA